jgi:thiosulfate reductase cytochrome b subunit
VIWAFTIFWQFTTGEWRHYIPSTQNVVGDGPLLHGGDLQGAPHPFRKTTVQKHNPLQRLAYLALLVHLADDLGLGPALPVLRPNWAQLGIDKMARSSRSRRAYRSARS